MDLVAKKRRVGDVIQVELPGSRFAYGPVLEDAAVAFYSAITTIPASPLSVVVTSLHRGRLCRRGGGVSGRWA